MRKMVFLAWMFLVIILFLAQFFTPYALAQASKLTPLEEKLYQAALKEKELVWWDQHSLKEAGEVIKEFNKKYPGIKITYFEGTTDVTLEKFFAEYKAGRASVDLLTAGSHLPFKKENLLTDLSDIIKDVNYPLTFCTKDLSGTTVDFGVYGVAYNTGIVSPQNVPKSWEDLLDPKWNGKINIEPRLKVFIFGTEHWGEKWIVDYLKKLRNQKPTFSKGVTQTMTLLTAGEFPIAVSIYLHRVNIMQGQGAPVAWAPINPAITGGTSPSLIPKTASHPNAAKLFLRWEISTEGQVFADKIRFKGNPMPGSGTSQSRIMEKLGIKIFSATDWAFENQERLETLYCDALGVKTK